MSHLGSKGYKSRTLAFEALETRRLLTGKPGDLLQTFSDPSPSRWYDGYGDRFGYSLAAVGGKVVIGAASDNDGASDPGSAYLFDPTTGQIDYRFHNPHPNSGDVFGTANTAQEDRLLIGAHGDSTFGSNAGSTYLYERDGAGWRLANTFHGTAGDYSGHAIGFYGQNILISAPGNDSKGTDAGAVYLLDGSSLNNTVLHTFYGKTTGDYFGFAGLDAIPGRVAIGAPGVAPAYDRPGVVFVYTPREPNSSNWNELIITTSTPQNGDRFGQSVLWVGENLLVGVLSNSLLTSKTTYIWVASLAATSFQSASVSHSHDMNVLPLSHTAPLSWSNRDVNHNSTKSSLFQKEILFRDE